MLSFEISAVDLVLFVAVIILFLLYLKFSTNFDWLNQKRLFTRLENVDERTEERHEIEDEREVAKASPLISEMCPYNFGYLKKLSGAASIPKKCLECSRILECRYEIISDSE